MNRLKAYAGVLLWCAAFASGISLEWWALDHLSRRAMALGVIVVAIFTIVLLCEINYRVKRMTKALDAAIEEVKSEMNP